MTRDVKAEMTMALDRLLTELGDEYALDWLAEAYNRIADSMGDEAPMEVQIARSMADELHRPKH